MAWHNKVEKIGRWLNIWLSQFSVLRLKNKRPEDDVKMIKIMHFKRKMKKVRTT